MPPEPAGVSRLTEGWTLALSAAGACATPADAARLGDWAPAKVPGAVAGALEQAGRWRRDAPTSLHDQDVWYTTDLPALGAGVLRFEGLATMAEVWLDDVPLLTSRAMFTPVEAAVHIDEPARLWICFRALDRALDAKGPRARWRPRMFDRQGLRLVRTTLLGHMPSWCPSIDIVGPYRPVLFIPRETPRPTDLRITADWDGRAQLDVELSLAGLEAPPVLACAEAVAPMEEVASGRYRGRLSPASALPWWPHTHGGQPLYAVRLQLPGGEIELARTGFRRVEANRTGHGFALSVNGVPIFCRGACWITPDLVNLDGGATAATLGLARDAGLNMVRVSGVGLYEDPGFFRACDELGLLVWQDFMFANFDYPAGDPGFVASVQAEARSQLSALQGAPCLAVLCGGSEVMQQAAMMGLPPLAWPLFDEVLAGLAAEMRPDVPYLPNTPHGGALPFVASQGVTHYYGVGAYERPLEDARRADVKFAAECLALANVPQPETLAAHFSDPPVSDCRWKARTPRDRGASWDFEDTRDHYLARLYEIDPARLRRDDPALYLDLSRAVSGEVMAAVFTEWRRAASRCAGGLVWTLRDLEIGPGWGLVDATGEPKPAWYGLRRVLRPVALAITDEGVNGLSVHLFNDFDEAIQAELRLGAFSVDGVVLEAARPVTLPARSAQEVSAFELIGRFFDISQAYRFGPPSHDAVRVELRAQGATLAEAVHILDPRAGLEPATVDARLEARGDSWDLILRSPRLLRYVHVSDLHYRPEDDGFALMPGVPKRLGLAARGDGVTSPAGDVSISGGRVVASYR